MKERRMKERRNVKSNLTQKEKENMWVTPSS